MSQILEAKVSLFESHFSQTPAKNASVRAVLASIAEPPAKRRGLVLGMREAMLAGDEAEADRLKRQLPVATFSGVFATKAGSGITGQSGWIPSGLACLDIDHLDTTGQAEELRDKILSCPHVLAAFVSPRGHGVKVLVGLVASTADEYSAAYAVACAHYRAWLGLALDNTSDAKRNCYLSFDPGVKVREGELASFRAPPATTPAPTGGEATYPLSCNPGADVVGRARAYLAAMPASGASGSPEGRNFPTFRAAFALVVKFALAPEVALPLLMEFDRRSHTPWTERELMLKLESAKNSRAARSAGGALQGGRFSKLRGEFKAAEARGDEAEAIHLAEVLVRCHEKENLIEGAEEWKQRAEMMRAKIRARTEEMGRRLRGQ